MQLRKASRGRRWTGPAAIVLILCASLAQAAEVPRDPYQFFFNDTFGDFTEELALAREQGKVGIMLFFEMDECPFCHRMKRTVLNQPRVQKWYRERFLLFSVDVEGDTEIIDFQGNAMPAKDFAYRVNRVRATPVFLFYDLDGNPMARYTGATRDVDEFMWLGEFVAGGHYRSTKFTRFKRSKQAEQKSSGQSQ